MIKCDEIIELTKAVTTRTVPTKSTSTKSNLTKNVPAKITSTNLYILLTVLLITMPLLVAVSIYCYRIKL